MKTIDTQLSPNVGRTLGKSFLVARLIVDKVTYLVLTILKVGVSVEK